MKEITTGEMSAIFDSKDMGDYQPIGRFYCQDGDRWIACDNSNGDAFTEDFRTKDAAISYLDGFMVAEQFQIKLEPMYALGEAAQTGREAWLTLPATAEQLAPVLRQLGITGCDYRVTGSEIPGDMDVLATFIREYDSIDKLNELAATIRAASPAEQKKIKAVLEYQEQCNQGYRPVNVDDALLALDCLHQFEVYEDIQDSRSLGSYMQEQARSGVADGIAALEDTTPKLHSYISMLEKAANPGKVVHMDESLRFQLTDSGAVVHKGSMPQKRLISAENMIVDKALSLANGGDRAAEASSIKDRLQAGREAAADHKPPEQHPKAGRDMGQER